MTIRFYIYLTIIISSCLDAFAYDYNNSPNNFNNSNNKYNNERIIRDENGKPKAYMVPKKNGGANIFDFDGNRLATYLQKNTVKIKSFY